MNKTTFFLFFITQALIMHSSSFCTLLTKLSRSLTTKEYCAILRKENKIHRETLRLLRGNSSVGIRKIWDLEDQIKKNNRRITTALQLNNSDDTTE